MSPANQSKNKFNKKMDITARLNLPLIGVMGLLICALFTSLYFYSQINSANLVINDLQSKHTELLTYYESSLSTANILDNYYNELTNNYEKLESSYEDLQEYYTGLQTDLIDLQEDQTELEVRYTSLLSDKQSLLYDKQSLISELDDIENLRKRVILEDNKTLEIKPSGDSTRSYETTYAGYIELNVSSSTDIIIWIGSSIANDTYYARLPPSFPDTVREGSFTIPTTRDTYIYVINPNEFLEAQIEISLIYIY